MTELPLLKIFLSSPGDVAEERALAEIVFRRLADEVSDIARLSLVIWEHEPVFGHTGYQQQIERPSQCDLVVSILWSRLGTRLPSDFAPAPGEPSPTGTEFELQDALASYADIGKPNLLIYRKIPGPQIGLGSTDFRERTDQYHRLDEFCRHAFYDAEGAVIVAHVTFTDSHDFERRLDQHVRRWLDRQIQSAHPEGLRPQWKGQSPFRGLQPFEASHQAIFSGRSEAVADLIRRLKDTEAASRTSPVTRLLLVQGMSGAGKTSLFNAGLLPLLDLRPVEGIAQWTTIILRPSESDPAMRNFGALGVLALRLCERVPGITRLGITVQKLAETLFERPEEAVAKIEICMAADAERVGIEPRRVRLLIYIDQLEENFGLPDTSTAAKPLFTAIVAFARSASIWIATTVRSDFVHRLEAFPDLMACLGRTPPYTLLPPRPDELAEMIREPAKAAGLIWEQRDGISLDQELLRDATGNPEALPLLEYTLAELYERREGRLLRWSEYGGGLRGALISAADEMVNGTVGDADTALRDVMRELVSVGDDGAVTRRYASLARFAPGGAARALLDRLVARRLCVTTDDGRGDGPVTYLAHEALIRSWPRAQRWLQQETSLLRVRDEVARDAAVWVFHKRADDWLGIAPEKLAAIRQVEQAGLMPADAAADYARASRRRAARDTFIKRAAIVGICLLTVLASAAWWVALQQRNMARTEAEIADRTKGFLISLFQLADPTENRGEKVTVKEVLDKGATEIRAQRGDNGLQREPGVRAELLTAMGQAYTGLGLYKPAGDLLSQAREDQQSGAVSDESRVRTLAATGLTLYLAGKYEAAESPLRDAVNLARAKLDPSNALRSAALTNLADVLVQLGKYAEAEQLCREALAADRKRGPAGVGVLASTLSSLASAYFYQGDLVAADGPMHEALELNKRAYGMQDAHTATALNNLAGLLFQSGKYEEAYADYEQALPLYRAVFGENHPEVSTLLNNLGRTALLAGHLNEAEPVLRQALAMTEQFMGSDHDYLVAPLNSLAMIDAYMGRIDQANSEIHRADKIARLPDHGELLDQVLLNEADLTIRYGDRARASAMLDESKKLLQQTHVNDSANAWRYAVWDTVDAELLALSGDAAGAARVLAAAQPIIVERFGVNGFYSLLAKRQTLWIASAPKAQQ